MRARPFVTALLGLFLLLGAAGTGRCELFEAFGAELHGFFDARYGLRTESDPKERGTSLGEGRLQLEAFRPGDFLSWMVRADFLYDEVPGTRRLDLEEGSGPIDLREANLSFSPADSVDVKAGRQILTWGTGDLLFINDLFPKDWQSFFIGRDEEYLKAPSDALFVSYFPSFADIDIAYSPRFDPDRYLSGERLSYYNPMLGRRAGRDAVIEAEGRSEYLEEDEIAFRLSRQEGGFELAFYGYDGFWKSPVGFDPAAMKATFPALTVYGASLRGALGKGIFNLEGGYYDSKEDRRGDDPNLPNGESRLLLGYERELARDFSASFQYYLEVLEDYGRYKDALPAGQEARDEERHLVTLRLTSRHLSQKLTLSLFSYYSPTDEDAYLRPSVRYKATDALLLTAGGNFFTGRHDHTFFGQLENNSNLYAGIRYSF